MILPPRKQARVFDLTEEQAQAALDDIIAGTYSLCSYNAYVLVDRGASHTFISEQFAISHDLPIEPLATVVSISLPLGKVIVSVKSVKNCILQYEGNVIEIDCIVLGLSDFGCIIDIDMLTKYSAIVDCFQKVVRFRLGMADEWKFYGKGSRARISLISVLSMTHLLQKGAEGFLIYAIDVLKTSPKLADLPVVSEFVDVFPDEITGFPPIRKTSKQGISNSSLRLRTGIELAKVCEFLALKIEELEQILIDMCSCYSFHIRSTQESRKEKL
ncbi:uncharacterized protein [Henckelia pumila]|uniref:uncharacterized protein n=1 Tax=Henckelia pumila TaxID=405737 RepID=UPI003C6E63D7